MKAAVFHGPQQPLTIEDVEIEKPIGREVLVRIVASGVCHSDLHFVDGFYPFPHAGRPRPRGGGHRRGGGPACDGVQAGRPRDRLPLGVLRSLRALPDRPDPTSAEPRPTRAAERAARLTLERRRRSTSSPTSRAYAEKMLVHENALVQDPRRRAAGPRGADRLRRHDGRRRGAEHGAGRAGLDGGGVRGRRRRAGGDPGRAHRRRAA